jgi:hypothetical protein
VTGGTTIVEIAPLSEIAKSETAKTTVKTNAIV